MDGRGSARAGQAEKVGDEETRCRREQRDQAGIGGRGVSFTPAPTPHYQERMAVAGVGRGGGSGEN